MPGTVSYRQYDCAEAWMQLSLSVMHAQGGGIAGYLLELASPAFPKLFLPLACLGSVSRATTGQ